jgi:hypothetical protein
MPHVRAIGLRTGACGLDGSAHLRELSGAQAVMLDPHNKNENKIYDVYILGGQHLRFLR